MVEANNLHHHYLRLMRKGGMIKNLSCEFTEYTQNGTLIPATVSDYLPKNCYAVSPLTQIIHYSRDELPKVKSLPLQLFCRFLISLAEWPLRLAKIDSVQILNNQCFATNSYPYKWCDLDISSLRSKALTRFPEHALMLRSLNKEQHSEIVSHLRKDGWLPIVNRQVYLLLDHKSWLTKRDSRRDLKLLDQGSWKFIPLDYNDEKQLKNAKKLYDQLYLEKYSHYNIQFSELFFKEFVKNKILKVYCLYRQEEMLGVVGLFTIDKTLTVPIVGYDTTKINDLALYRRLIIFTNRYAMNNNLQINQSSGAPQFKRNRGAEPAIEYNFVYIDHLPIHQQIIWSGLSLISRRIYKPILEHFEL